jgi:cobalt/nickel transport system permease protein
MEVRIMHMADALISPAVGGTMWAVSAGLVIYSSKKISRDGPDNRTALMGVLGAFIFAAQMINFSIPATGSSGHLGGGLILSILLGPYAGFIVMASVLTVQALIFGDGGLLALGCNIFNLGFWTCFVIYPLIYKKIAGKDPSQVRIITGSLLAAIIGLQLGAFSVVLETIFSGISDLPFKSFVLLMQPIHLAIGIVEGIVTAAVITFVWKAKPEIVSQNIFSKTQTPVKSVVIAIGIAAILTGGILAWFASSHPDGLEWAMFHTSGKEEIASPKDNIHEILASIQEKTAILPDYNFKQINTSNNSGAGDASASWPGISAGTSFAGIIGGILTLAVAFLIGTILRRIGNKERT